MMHQGAIVEQETRRLNQFARTLLRALSPTGGRQNGKADPTNPVKLIKKTQHFLEKNTIEVNQTEISQQSPVWLRAYCGP